MRSFYPRLLILAGLLLIAFGGGVGVGLPAPARAQNPESAAYVGAADCATCHPSYTDIHNLSRHALTLRDVTAEKSAILADFRSGEGERTVQFPGESGPRPFTANDIAYVVGAGANIQRYITRLPDGSLMLLPAQITTARKTWQRYDLAPQWPAPAYDWNLNCAGCHSTGHTIADGQWKDDGVQCEACHGPGRLHSDLARQAGQNPTPDQLTAIRTSTHLSADGQVCGQCHSGGHEPTQNLPYPLAYRPGGTLLAPTTFALLNPADPNYWSKGGRAIRPNMQYNEWVVSPHGNSLDELKASPDADPSCLRCHSADVRVVSRLNEAHKAGLRRGELPAPLTVEAAQTGVTCVACHDPHLVPKEADKAAQPFHLTAPANDLCMSCHNDQGLETPHSPVKEIYDGLPIVDEVKGIASRHSTLKAAPRCVTCHVAKVSIDGVKVGTHNLKAVTTGPIDADLVRSSCTGCHTNYAGPAMQRFVETTQGRIKARWEKLNAALTPSSPAWVRRIVQAVERDGSWGIHNPRYVIALLRAAEGALGVK
jgi:predicted CXXCH cytochrome family protein